MIEFRSATALQALTDLPIRQETRIPLIGAAFYCSHVLQSTLAEKRKLLSL